MCNATALQWQQNLVLKTRTKNSRIVHVRARTHTHTDTDTQSFHIFAISVVYLLNCILLY